MIQEFWEIVKKQGFSISLLCLVTWYFYNKTEDLETKIDDCNGYNKEITTQAVEQWTLGSRIIEKNTEVLKRVERKLDD